MRSAPELPRALRAAYARTGYEAAGIVARIGRRNPALDALLRERGVRRAGFVTAWNPYSRKMPRGWNDRMLERLRQAARGHVLAEGWGRGRGWAEQHLLIAGDPRRIALLARRFRQHALVMVAPGQPPRIVPGLHPPATEAPPGPATQAELG
jgi:peptidoglycan/xylan/chitin deacetylase (PgdA/CDA1 family)